MTAPLVTDDQPKTDSKRMTLEQIRAAAHRLIASARTYVESELSPERAKATDYYKGKPFGNEEEGRSQVVLTEVRDTVRGILPSLLRMFFGGEQAVEYEPHGQEDVEHAEQATDFVNSVIVQQDNNGFLVFDSWFKDALIREQGVVKWWWEKSTKVEARVAYNVSDDQLLALISDDSTQISRVTPTGEAPMMTPQGVELVPVYSVEFHQSTEDGRARFECVPPEEVLFTRGSRSKQQAPLVAHQTEKTTSELLELGVSEAMIRAHGGLASRDQTEEQARQDTTVAPETTDWPNKLHTYTEAWVYLDTDGDGITELRKLCCLGSGAYVVNGDGYGEPAAERPFAFLIPDPEPHTMKGQGVYSWVKDIQLWKSSLVRAINDSLAQSIFPRTAYVEGAVELADLQSTKIGQPITVLERQPPNQVLQEFAHEFHGAKALPVIDMIDQIKQGRVGPLPARLDPDALQSSTKSAVDASVTGAQEHVEMIARVFAETGVKDLFRGLLKLVVQNQPRARMVRLRNKYVEIDPRRWNAEMDVRVNVALGGGLMETKVSTLMGLAEKQEQVLQALGPSNPLFTLGHYRNTLAAILELQGRKDIAKFMNDVPVDWQPPPPDPNQQDPAQMIAQAEMAKAQAEIAKKQADIAKQEVELAHDRAKLGIDAAARERELQLQQEAMLLEDDRERDKLDADIRLKARELELEYNAKVDIAEIQAAIDEKRATIDANAKVAAAKAGKKVTVVREGPQ